MGETDLSDADVAAMMVLLSDWENDKAREGLADQNEAANAGSCFSTSPSGSRSAGSAG